MFGEEVESSKSSDSCHHSIMLDLRGQLGEAHLADTPVSINERDEDGGAERTKKVERWLEGGT